MAIQHRRGTYADFNPSKMTPGELAVVQSGDPSATDGKTVYMAFAAGNVKRLATLDELHDQVSEEIITQTEEIVENIRAGVADDVERAEQAAEDAAESAATLEIDPTLSIEGRAADAKATGRAISMERLYANTLFGPYANIEAEDTDVGKVLAAEVVQGGVVQRYGLRRITVPAVDDTLTTSGAAADAKVTGGTIRSLQNAINADKDLSHMAYVITSVNLFNKDDCEDGDIKADGEPSEITTAKRTKRLMRISGDSIVSNYNMRKVFYDKNGVFISRSASTTDAVEIPENAVYVRFTISASNYTKTDIMANIGDAILPYQPFDLKARIVDAALEPTELAENVSGILEELENTFQWSGSIITNSSLSTIVPSSDFNNLTDGLVYAVSLTSQDALNKPLEEMYGVFLSVKYSSTATAGVAQLHIGRDGQFCYRYLHSGGWSQWWITDANKIKRLDDVLRIIQSDKTSVNLFDTTDCELGAIQTNGKDSASTTTMRTIHLVPFNGEKIASSCSCSKAYYDKYGNFLSRSSSNTLDTVPTGAAYVRFVVSTSNYESQVMINVGETVLPYQPFSLYTDVSEQINKQIEDVQYYSELYKSFKRVGVIGDSLSVGYSGHTGSWPKIIERNLAYSWPKCIGRDADAYWLNFGEHGMNTLTWCSSATRGKIQMEAEGNKCQAYIICLGVNDASPSGARHVDVGQPSDIVDNPDTVATTYYGGFARIIQLVKRRNPDARIFCSTIPNEQRSNILRERYKPYNDAVRYIAETYYTTDDNVFLLDMAADYGYLFNTIGAPLYIEQVGDNAVSHFSSVGYQMISKIYEEAISKVMLKYQPKFMDIMYIPCDTAEPTLDVMEGYEEDDN